MAISLFNISSKMRMMIDKVFKSFLENRYLSRWVILFIDLIIVSIASSFSYLVVMQIYRKLGVIKHPEFFTYFAITFVVSFICFLLLKTFEGIIRYSTIREIKRIFTACVSADLLIFFLLYLVLHLSGTVSLTYCSIFFILNFIGLFLFRIFVVYIFQQLANVFGTNQPIPVYIWDADEQDMSMAQVINDSRNKFKIKGFILNSDNIGFNQGSKLPICKIEEIEDIYRYDIKNVLFTDQKLVLRNTEDIEKMLANGIRIYVVQLKNIEHIRTIDDVISKQIRPLQIEDLLSRPEIQIDLETISKCVANKTILVTGAAGSIGSEIVRQLANFQPNRIICLDQAETHLNDLSLELKKKHPHLNFDFIIADIRNKNKLSKTFEQIKPDIVYHAAAYKHVPMMEKSPSEAIITNVGGTKNLVDLSIEFAVEKFVMVSTDKAVNPTNVMGASKRIAEIYTQSIAVDVEKSKSETQFITTRFGNVLGSNGSVIPLFKKQIEVGGPITVTHPDITRYFMTIPEACRLVLEASHIGTSGHIYVFDMGEPIKILDMATKMIELAGFKPQEDIKIVFSGLRPGEKLYEELLNDSELTIPTSHEKVMIAEVRKYNFAEISSAIDQLIEEANAENSISLIKLMKKLVPEFISENSEYEILDQENKV